jgi:hypothetical protein
MGAAHLEPASTPVSNDRSFEQSAVQRMTAPWSSPGRCAASLRSTRGIVDPV